MYANVMAMDVDEFSWRSHIVLEKLMMERLANVCECIFFIYEFLSALCQQALPPINAH